MKYEAQKITLKDGRSCVLRSAEKPDAAEMLRYMVQVLSETPYLLSTSEEFAQMPLKRKKLSSKTPLQPIAP